MNYQATIEHLKGSTKVDPNAEYLKSTELLLVPVIVPSISSAILISMYGDFEYYLNEICNAYKKDKQLNLSFKDISGSGILRAVTYLEKVVGIKKIKQSKEWASINDWNLIRNALVHRNGILNEEKEVNVAKRLELSFNQDFLEAGIMKLNINLDNCTEFGNCSGEFFQICIRDITNLD